MKRNPRDIIVRPIITEKTVAMQQNDNKVTFEVAKGSNKIEIRQAIEEIFNVKVEKINVINVLPRKKRVGRYEGQTKAVRKAIVKLAEGSKIEVL
ncbi:50S ribosomal protein L23 [Erysipelothrix rhusiopathiae]|uniref:Large ribosomal subunit protein uL23 n=2 Tax=Erysipelothrix TaxID=1647 RepID=E7FW27_ERYRH|nr:MULTISPECIES: 50S ribosomal protein L23 [Erysipelothrix]CAH2763120.1 50S ribosomal protein L23 [Erysipelothrix sp. A18Y020d]AGN24404.1 50S ribosomal protein L23 [Erysipelothrix rhusiopathiae SY1027]AMS10847.1 50S ribosomal protein L23 [Erysipelothrix rhusiopathiae]AOO66879.1 50S ribosomal protein L23 [Erysipelothrix rhusiopathiae]AWU41786.1 50S ribosomal protein L23 [Erysipelothrix rhusiopathiae]